MDSTIAWVFVAAVLVNLPWEVALRPETPREQTERGLPYDGIRLSELHQTGPAEVNSWSGVTRYRNEQCACCWGMPRAAVS